MKILKKDKSCYEIHRKILMPFKRYTDRTLYVEFCERVGVKYINRDNGEQMKARVVNFLKDKGFYDSDFTIMYGMFSYAVYNSTDIINDKLIRVLNKKVYK
jgi:hypothetical protein